MKIIKLTNRGEVMVDNNDFDSVSRYKWYCKSSGYAARCIYNKKTKKQTQQTLHCFIIGKAPKGKVIDHIDGNKLNNQRNNLRICSQSINRQNSIIDNRNKSGKKGVSLAHVKQIYKGKTYNNYYWRAILMCRGKIVLNKHFKNKEDAIVAYNSNAIKFFGKYAKTNK